ncbi:hypothetical protein FDG94_gp113 [Pseudomonas phage SM1]|uniref:Uncharacterized protein n=2 Tax=Samunavirus TaxID=2560221 RepID=A0A0U2UUX5_9CAUD|nr:hypothetical protein FDG94_gp113 [Pseudomonas phage SM1]ALT58105.1 hypothetical protein SM1_0113 [Pseudomonas phage SM1]UVN14026.1 hypothetical protein FBPa45_0024 [Pseudomonas phage vB_PaeS_FBPa45]WDS62458.1 hypothetical protein UFRH6_28 [Pseudomonas phage UF_RH6]HBO9768513.1 hypothetical protein [Pseudomonas aeruginosa]
MTTVTSAPEEFQIVDPDINERIQAGDLLWDPSEFDWLPACRSEIGEYVYGFAAVARRKAEQPKPELPAVKRLPRRVRPTK